MTELVYRPATLDDAELACDLMTAAYPAMVHDPVIMRHRWEHKRDGYSTGRYIVEMEGRSVAFVGWVHGPWEKLPDRHCEIEVWLDKAVLDGELLTALWTWIAGQAEAEGSGILLAFAAEDETQMLAALNGLGFVRDRLEKVWELDLRVHGPRLVAEANDARQKIAASGIELLTLAAWHDPRKLEKLHELDAVTRQDVPHTLPIIPESFEDFARRTNAPDRPHDRYWIAVDGDRPVALSYLRFPPVRGTIWTGYTCAHPEYRGRGLARAIKLQSLAQAVELGTPVVATDNDSENAPMLHINEQLGYQRRPGFVGHLKRVTRKGA